MSLKLIGGDMPAWSDLDGSHGPGPVRGVVLKPLLDGATGRVLVLGPHDPALLDRLPAGDLTVLVRGIPDAEALAARLPGATICCGAPEKFAAETPFDAVVALDGFDRLSSVEGAQLDWAAAADLVHGWLRPGGRLVLGMTNLFGLDRLAAPPAEPTDSDWTPIAEHDRTRPAGLAALLNRLPAPATAYAAFPSAVAPTALVEVGALRDPEMCGLLEATIGEACRPTTDVLTDPRTLAIAALRHGLAADLAPGWFAVAGAVTALPVALVDRVGRVDATGSGPPDARVLRDVLAERDRLARELTEARAKATWYEQTLTAREDALKRAQRTVELLSATGPARVGAALMGGARAARRSARGLIRRVTPRT